MNKQDKNAWNTYLVPLDYVLLFILSHNHIEAAAHAYWPPHSGSEVSVGALHLFEQGLRVGVVFVLLVGIVLVWSGILVDWREGALGRCVLAVAFCGSGTTPGQLLRVDRLRPIVIGVVVHLLMQ